MSGANPRDGREELRRAFDAMTSPPSPGFQRRVRSALAERAEAPSRAPQLALAVLAAVLAAAVVAVLLVARGAGGPFGPAPIPAASPSASASPTPAPTSSPGPTPTPTPTPELAPPPSGSAFSCTVQRGGAAAQARVVAVRVGSSPGYDRFVIEFDGGVPAYTVTPQASSTFVQDASGQPIRLDGAAGLSVRLEGASQHDGYSGPTDLTPGYQVLREARLTGDFEGVVSWGLGLSRGACFRAFTLDGPPRLVVDVATG
jgi:hypothetical protein